MGNLIVKNSAGQVAIIEVEVKQNGQTIKKLSGLCIPNGDQSDPITLNGGLYEVTVKVKDKGGNILQDTKQVIVPKEGEYVHVVPPLPEEEKTSVPLNLV